MEKLSKRDCREGINCMLKKIVMMSTATFLPKFWNYVFKDLKCASYVSSKIHYIQTVSVLSQLTFHDNICIVCVINISVSPHGQSTFQEIHCSGRKARFRWGGQRPGEERNVQVKRAGLTSYCSVRAWEKALLPHRAFHLCTSGCASYFNI